MMTSEGCGSRGVTVAILDSNVNRVHAYPPEFRDRVRLGTVTEDQSQRVFLGHGAVTASIIGCLAPTATVLVYPIADSTRNVDEVDAGDVLWSAVADGADVIVMCLALPDNKGTGTRRQMERALEGRPTPCRCRGERQSRRELRLGLRAVPRDLPDGSHGRRDHSARLRPRYSGFKMGPAQQPRLFVVAPGGDGTNEGATEWSVSVGGSGKFGTSIAAAYAAGVIARHFSSIETPPPDAETLIAQFAAKAEMSNGWSDVEYGRGLIRQP